VCVLVENQGRDFRKLDPRHGGWLQVDVSTMFEDHDGTRLRTDVEGTWLRDNCRLTRLFDKI
jgi:hypothetical protein